MAERRLKTPIKPHFFQPLLPGFQHHLSIPVSFYLKHLKEKNAEKAVLRSPSGKLWHMKINGRFIEDGWQEFCEDHRFHVGDFLVFRQDGDFLFDVLVFDSTACQRDYPAFIKDEIVEAPQQETPKESAGQLRKKKKKKKKGKTKFEGKAGFSASQYPHFVMNFTEYSAKCYKLNIPTEFARVNDLKNRCCKVVLLSEHGKVWVARLGFKQRAGLAYIKHQWSAFRRANSIKAGDSCLFELIRDGEKPVFKITKCAQELMMPNPLPKQEPTNNTALAGASSRNPRVRVTVQESYDKNNRLRIPNEFAKKSGFTEVCPEAMTIRNEKGKSWTVSLWKARTGVIHIGLGWSTFTRSNGIKAGDVLMLELIGKGSKPVVRISGVKRVARGEKKRLEICADDKADAKIKQEVE